MASPSMTTSGTTLLASTSIAAAGTDSTSNLDISTKFEAQIQVAVTFGTVATTSGLKVEVFRRIGGTPTVDTQPVTSFIIPSAASSSLKQSFALPTGRYNIKLTNTDAANGLTAVSMIYDTVDAVA